MLLGNALGRILAGGRRFQAQIELRTAGVSRLSGSQQRKLLVPKIGHVRRIGELTVTGRDDPGHGLWCRLGPKHVDAGCSTQERVMSRVFHRSSPVQATAHLSHAFAHQGRLVVCSREAASKRGPMIVSRSYEGLSRPQVNRGAGERGSDCIGHVEDITKDQNKGESSQLWSCDSLCKRWTSIIVGWNPTCYECLRHPDPQQPVPTTPASVSAAVKGLLVR